MSKQADCPSVAPASKPRWFGHPAFLAFLGMLIVIDVAAMHRNAFIKQLNRPVTTRYLYSPASIHDDGTGLTIRWQFEPGYGGDASDFVEYFALARWMLDQPSGRWHATSRQSRMLPWPLLEGYSEAALASAIHDSAVASDSEGARFLRAQYPDAMALLAQGKLHDEKPLPMGYVRNAILFGLVFATVSCSIFGRFDLWMRRILVAIGPPKRGPNACPRCHYDCVGLANCPECGTSVNRGLR